MIDAKTSRRQPHRLAGDAKDHPGYGPTVEAGTVDAKDHPGYDPTVGAGTVDAKDHPGYNPTVEAGMTTPRTTRTTTPRSRPG